MTRVRPECGPESALSVTRVRPECDQSRASVWTRVRPECGPELGLPKSGENCGSDPTAEAHQGMSTLIMGWGPLPFQPLRSLPVLVQRSLL